ncbi:hypothetical protein [Thalassotalea profundi]|uniref:Uncharacterized protein n=1 Tax=Thalassotalea profundi TaxID=2036687 RepID=A0ABQ3IJX6_9GAMM|nr:hypothetical protein [Thalassotalea profundi]GHE84483.1 hypothetical protein GCM10011501_11500 [Thalassotalea profundi]
MGYQATNHNLDLINTIQLEILSDFNDIKTGNIAYVPSKRTAKGEHCIVQTE